MTSILFLIMTNFMESIQIQLPKKQKLFCQLFSAFLVIRLNFENLKKKDDPHSLCFSEIRPCERHG